MAMAISRLQNFFTCMMNNSIVSNNKQDEIIDLINEIKNKPSFDEKLKYYASILNEMVVNDKTIHSVRRTGNILNPQRSDIFKLLVMDEVIKYSNPSCYTQSYETDRLLKTKSVHCIDSVTKNELETAADNYGYITTANHYVKQYMQEFDKLDTILDRNGEFYNIKALKDLLTHKV